MRVFWFPVWVLAVLTSACASRGSLPAVATAAPVVSAPLPTVGYDWHFTPSDQTLHLAYGVAQSDDLKLGLSCVVRSGTIDLTVPGPAGAREIHLESGGETQRLAARGETSQLHDGDILTASASAAEPVFQRFRRLGWMAQWIDGTREVYAPHPGAEAGVEKFFTDCD